MRVRKIFSREWIMQSASSAISPAEHEAGDFTGMLNAHQQEWCESNNGEVHVGSSNQRFWPWFQCRDHEATALPILSTAPVWNYWSTMDKLRWITKHCSSSWLHDSPGCCVSVFPKSQFQQTVCRSLQAIISNLEIRLKNWVVTDSRGDESHLFCISSRVIGTLTQTPLSKYPSPCEFWQEMQGLDFSSIFGVGNNPAVFQLCQERNEISRDTK